jgi:hypothetical protein
MSVDAAALFALKTGILQSVQAYLATSLGGEVERACVVPGALIAWDECECGQLTVHHTTMWPSQAFPDPVERERANCAVPWWVVEIVVTLVRCVPVGTDEAPPTCEELAQAATIQDHDLQMMQRGVACALTTEQYRIQDHTSLGPEGACVGSQLTIWVAVSNCPDDCA